jgi:acetyl esterase/lipase
MQIVRFNEAIDARPRRAALWPASRVARAVLIAAAALASAACARGYFATLNSGAVPEGVRIERGIVYGSDRGPALDVYRPHGAAPAPVVVFFYGGRWQGGDRRDYSFVGEALAGRGFVGVLPDYRQYPEVGFPGFVDDAARALAWAIENAATFGGDPARVFVAGHSAGGHIAALLATDARYLAAHGLAPRQLAGAIAIAAPLDFLPIVDADIAAIFGPPERYAESQPVNFVEGDEPPFLLLHGQSDQLVWTHNSRNLAARLEAAAVPVELTIYPDIGHFRILAALDPQFDWLAPTLEDLARFVESMPAVRPVVH